MVAPVFKRVATLIGMSSNEVEQIGGHSARVGATQDLLALNIDLTFVMQIGHWKTNRCRCAMVSTCSLRGVEWRVQRRRKEEIVTRPQVFAEHRRSSTAFGPLSPLSLIRNTSESALHERRRTRR